MLLRWVVHKIEHILAAVIKELTVVNFETLRLFHTNGSLHYTGRTGFVLNVNGLRWDGRLAFTEEHYIM